MNFRRNTPPGRFAELTLGKVGIFAELLYIDFSADLTGKSWDFGGMNVHAGLNFYFLPTAGMKAPLPVRFRPEFSRSSGSE